MGAEFLILFVACSGLRVYTGGYRNMYIDTYIYIIVVFVCFLYVRVVMWGSKSKVNAKVWGSGVGGKGFLQGVATSHLIQEFSLNA